MSIIENFATNVKAQLYERIANPLTSTFVISWLLWNYKVVMVLFSSDSLIHKFAFIHNSIFITFGDALLYGFIYPAISTYIYLFLLPSLSLIVYKKWKKDQEALVSSKNEIEKNRLLTQEESDNLRTEIYDFKEATKKKYKTLEDEKEAYSRALQNEKDSNKIIEEKYRSDILKLEQVIDSFNTEKTDTETNAKSLSELKNEIESLKKDNNFLMLEDSIPASKSTSTNIHSHMLNDDEKFLLLIDELGEANAEEISKKLNLSSESVIRKINKFIKEINIKKVEDGIGAEKAYFYLTTIGQDKVNKIKNTLPF